TTVRHVLAELEGEFSRQDVDHFIAGVVNMERRSTASRHHFLEDRHTLARLLAEQLKGCRSTHLHLPNRSLVERHDVTRCIRCHATRPPMRQWNNSCVGTDIIFASSYILPSSVILLLIKLSCQNRHARMADNREYELHTRRRRLLPVTVCCYLLALSGAAQMP